MQYVHLISHDKSAAINLSGEVIGKHAGSGINAANDWNAIGIQWDTYIIHKGA